VVHHEIANGIGVAQPLALDDLNVRFFGGRPNHFLNMNIVGHRFLGDYWKDERAMNVPKSTYL
jgi:hypothetical protein